MAYKIIKSIYAVTHMEQVDFKHKSDNDCLICIRFVSGDTFSIQHDSFDSAEQQYQTLLNMIGDSLENKNK